MKKNNISPETINLLEIMGSRTILPDGWSKGLDPRILTSLETIH